VWLTGKREVMGGFANSKHLAVVAWAAVSLIVALNLFLVWQVF
jgi:Mn2+/Fe2+ NRAMP family transporter